MECSPSKWSGVLILFDCLQSIWGSTLSNFAKEGSHYFFIFYINIWRQCWGLKFEVEVQTKIFCTTKLLAPSVVPVCVGQVSLLCLVGTWSNFAFVFSTLLHFISLTSSLLPPWCLSPLPITASGSLQWNLLSSQQWGWLITHQHPDSSTLTIIAACF